MGESVCGTGDRPPRRTSKSGGKTCKAVTPLSSSKLSTHICQPRKKMKMSVSWNDYLWYQYGTVKKPSTLESLPFELLETILDEVRETCARSVPQLNDKFHSRQRSISIVSAVFRLSLAHLASAVLWPTRISTIQYWRPSTSSHTKPTQTSISRWPSMPLETAKRLRQSTLSPKIG